jgi:ABC-type transporter Mla subunit MlaD
MTNDLFSGLNDRSKEFMERASQFNETLFHQLSRAAEIQMESLRRYTDIASDQSQKLAEARNLEDLKKLSEGQAQALREISEQVSSDWQAWQNYLFEARAQLKSSIKGEQEQSQPSKPASKARSGGGNAS